MNKVRELFDKYSDQKNRFDLVADRKVNKRDLQALLILHEIIPNYSSTISSADAQIIYLTADIDDLSNASEEQIANLIRCNVFIDEDGSLAMTAYNHSIP